MKENKWKLGMKGKRKKEKENMKKIIEWALIKKSEGWIISKKNWKGWMKWINEKEWKINKKWRINWLKEEKKRKTKILNEKKLDKWMCVCVCEKEREREGER